MNPTFSLEENIAEIRTIVENMQKGITDFDEQIRMFEKGSALILSCQEYLNEAEMKVKKLVEGNLEEMEMPGSQEKS